MKNYISINNQKIELTEEQGKRIAESLNQDICERENPGIKLAEVPAGEVVEVGGYELLVLEQLGESTAVICKDLVGDDSAFGENNNYDGSYVDEICNSFSEAIADAVGEDNLLAHTVDLTSDDGLKDYGMVERRVSLLTAQMYRKYVEILDTVKPNRWWWLATAHSTKKHENDFWAKCVSPSGFIYNGRYYYGDYGVRPFCILKSNIFVSQ